ncbi:MAG: hypothetical protein ABIH72_05495 [archaeon]
MINKPVKVILLDDAKESFIKLNEIVGKQLESGKTNSQEMQLFKSIKNKVELIKENPFYGDNIKKELIPKKFNVSNLWRVELTNFWRMIYTIKGDEIDVICFILNITNHKDYNRIFGYKSK